MRYRYLGAIALLTVTTVSSAQRVGVRPEIRPFAGVYVPAGALRNDFKTATMLGMQVAMELSDHMHVLGSLGWTHGHAKFAALSDDVAYIWQYDAGVEFNLMAELGNGWLLRPLAGLGAGGRTYDYQAAGVGTNSCLAGYGALGSELQKGAIALRVEGRNYLACVDSPRTGRQHTRNDFGIMFGFAYHLR